MLADRQIEPVTHAEIVRILRIFWLGLLLRVALVLAFQFTGVERTLKLTKDAFLYDRIGKQIAEYFRTGGETDWPARVTGVLDHLYEYFVGVTYYLTDDSMLAVRLVNALCGSLVILVTWRMARYLTDADTAFRCGLWAGFFPTLFYYSCLPVRDAQSTLGMAFVFLGMTAITASGKTRYMMALPLGLLLMAGYRAYVAYALVMLIPAAWLATLIATRSREKFQLACRNMLVAVLAEAAVVPLAGEKLSSTRKAEAVTNIGRWNKIRRKMNDGTGALYEKGAVPSLGESALETTQSVAVGIYFFFLSINPTEMGSFRQWMALPEALLVLYMMPKLFRGFRCIMRQRRFEFLSVLLVTAAISLAYCCVTTNGGPLIRWRLQVVNVYIVVAAIGFAGVCVREKGADTSTIGGGSDLNRGEA
jgi:hypothetical protein